MELAVHAPDERLRESVGVVDEVEGEAALDEKVALVREVLVLRGDLDDVLRLRIEVEVDLAANATKCARRAYLLSARSGCSRALLQLLVDGARLEYREAAAAELALRVEPGEPPGGDDARRPASPLERERGALHDLLRVADAAGAQDARAGVVAHELVAVVVLLALRVRKDERRLGAELVREVEELVRAAAGRRVQVLGEEHLGERALKVGDRSRLWRRTMPSSTRAARRRHRPRRALDVDDAACGSRRRGRACRRGRAWG